MATLESVTMKRKTISVSKKRQITIPLQFYKHLDLNTEVECSLEDGAIIIRPSHRGTTEFSVEILKDLLNQGYSGDELIKQFEVQSDNIKTAFCCWNNPYTRCLLNHIRPSFINHNHG